MIQHYASSFYLHRFNLVWLAAILLLLFGYPAIAQAATSLNSLIEVQENPPIQFTLQGDLYKGKIHVRPGQALQESFNFVVMLAEVDNPRNNPVELKRDKVLKSESDFKEIPLEFQKNAVLPTNPKLFLRADAQNWRETLPLKIELLTTELKPSTTEPQNPTITLEIQKINNESVENGKVSLSAPPQEVNLDVLIKGSSLTENIKVWLELRSEKGKSLGTSEQSLKSPGGEATVNLSSKNLPEETERGKVILTAKVTAVAKESGGGLSKPISLLPEEVVTLTFPAPPDEWKQWLWVIVPIILFLLVGIVVLQNKSLKVKVLGVRCPECHKLYRWKFPSVCGNTNAHKSKEPVPLFGVEVVPDKIEFDNERRSQTISLSNLSVIPIQVLVESKLDFLRIAKKQESVRQPSVKEGKLVKALLGVKEKCELEAKWISERGPVFEPGKHQVTLNPITIKIVHPKVDFQSKIPVIFYPKEKEPKPSEISDVILITPKIELKEGQFAPIKVTNQAEKEEITVQLTNKPDWVNVFGLPLELKPQIARECLVWANEKADEFTKVVEDILSWQVRDKEVKSTQVRYTPPIIADAICPDPGCQHHYTNLAEIPARCSNCNHPLFSVQIEPSVIVFADFTLGSGFAPQSIRLINKSIVPVEVQLAIDNGSEWLSVKGLSLGNPFELTRNEEREIVVWADNAKAAQSPEPSLEGRLTLSGMQERIKEECIVRCHPQKEVIKKDEEETIEEQLKPIQDTIDIIKESLEEHRKQLEALQDTLTRIENNQTAQKEENQKIMNLLKEQGEQLKALGQTLEMLQPQRAFSMPDTLTIIGGELKTITGEIKISTEPKEELLQQGRAVLGGAPPSEEKLKGEQAEIVSSTFPVVQTEEQPMGEIAMKIASFRKELEAKSQSSDIDFMRWGQTVYQSIQDTKEKTSPQGKAYQQLDDFWSEVKEKFKERRIWVIDEVDRPYEDGKHLVFGDKRVGKVAKVIKVGYQYPLRDDPKSHGVEKAQVILKG